MLYTAKEKLLNGNAKFPSALLAVKGHLTSFKVLCYCV